MQMEIYIYISVWQAKDGKTKLRKVAVNIPQKLAEWGVEMEKMMKVYRRNLSDL